MGAPSGEAVVAPAGAVPVLAALVVVLVPVLALPDVVEPLDRLLVVSLVVAAAEVPAPEKVTVPVRRSWPCGGGGTMAPMPDVLVAIMLLDVLDPPAVEDVALAPVLLVEAAPLTLLDVLAPAAKHPALFVVAA